MIDTFLVEESGKKRQLFISNREGFPVVIDLTKEQEEKLIKMGIEIFKIEVPF